VVEAQSLLTHTPSGLHSKFGPQSARAVQGFGSQWRVGPHTSAAVQSSSEVQPGMHTVTPQYPVGLQILSGPASAQSASTPHSGGGGGGPPQLKSGA
jgi:hypothetical protein